MTRMLLCWMAEHWAGDCHQQKWHIAMERF